MGPPAASLAAFRQAHPPAELRVDGASWEYICTGQGERALLFLHGMAGAHDIWWQQIEALQDRFRTVSLTYPAVDTLEGLRQGINAVLEDAGVQRFAVVGTSLGGYLAQYLVARQPGRIRQAVFANTFPPNLILARRTRGADLLIRLVPQALLMAGMRWNTRLSIYPASGRSALLKGYLDEGTHRSMDKARFLARYRAVVEWFDPPDLAEIPVMIVESANDPLISPALRQLLRRTYPSARVHTFGAVGHFPYVNEPQAYSAVLEEFLAQPARGG
ncbi:MAG TPA: alpha/beta hydrolase [Anaerolineales bacterium]|nr:alpha/beta hydrolase [Anaerolineales bacterium]